MTEFAACDTGRQAIIADGNLFIDKLISKIIGTLGHGSHENTDALLVI